MAMLNNQMVIHWVISNLGDPQYCSRTQSKSAVSEKWRLFFLILIMQAM